MRLRFKRYMTPEQQAEAARRYQQLADQTKRLNEPRRNQAIAQQPPSTAKPETK